MPPAASAPSLAMRVAVVVLGDLGRSPRMQYHARALAADGAAVDLIGESGTPVLADLGTHPNVACHLLAPARAAHERSGSSFLLTSAARMARQALALLFLLLWRLPRPDIILVQTPPALPTLLIALIAARCRRSRLVIDWHNFGYSMLAARPEATHWLVRAARAYEARLAPWADAHLCVSLAMRQELKTAWRVDATVLYDEPAQQFVPIPEDRRAALLTRALPKAQFGVDWRAANRPPLIVTSTSWTDDEDFDLLLEAASLADEALCRNSEPLPSPSGLFILITGAGRRRAACEARIRQLALTRVRLHTAWLAAEDYAGVLGAADLGVSLHRSTSGFDLPMKIADMHGAGLPVSALNYAACLTERIDHGGNGLLFTTAAELAEQWLEMFRGFPQRSALLERLQRGVAATRSATWSQNWSERAAPVFRTLQAS